MPVLPDDDVVIALHLGFDAILHFKGASRQSGQQGAFVILEKRQAVASGFTLKRLLVVFGQLLADGIVKPR